MVYDFGKGYDNSGYPSWDHSQDLSNFSGDPNSSLYEGDRDEFESLNKPKQKPASDSVPATELSESTFDLIKRKKGELAQANIMVGPIPIGFPIPKFPWMNQQDLWKIHNLIVNGINPLTGNIIESEQEKKALNNFTGEQIAGLKKTRFADEIEYANDSFRNKRGCTCIQENMSFGNAARSLAIEALTGADHPTLIVDPFGHAARFDGMYPGNNPNNPRGAKKDYDRLKDKVYQVELLSPQNPAQEAKELARLKGKGAQWEIESMIAAQCGYEMRVAITDTALVQHLNESIFNDHPNFKIVEGHLGGTYGQVRANTVGGEVHHMPADGVSPVSRAKGSAIWMQIPHHGDTKSSGSSDEAKDYRAKQRELIKQG